MVNGLLLKLCFSKAPKALVTTVLILPVSVFCARSCLTFAHLLTLFINKHDACFRVNK